MLATPRQRKRTQTPGINVSYNQVPFKYEKPSQALIEENDYMERYANDPPACLRWVQSVWQKLRSSLR